MPSRELRRVGVFCGARPGGRVVYADAAREFGTALARAGLGLVYGGASIGLMGILADAALAAGGEVIGVIPKFMVDKELAHRGLTELRIVQSMAERKEVIDSLSSAFVALPGGFGTLDELFEMVTASYLGFHQKPVGLLEVAGFFHPLLMWMRRAVEDGFVSAEQLGAIRVAGEPAALLLALRA